MTPPLASETVKEALSNGTLSAEEKYTDSVKAIKNFLEFYKNDFAQISQQNIGIFSREGQDKVTKELSVSLEDFRNMLIVIYEGTGNFPEQWEVHRQSLFNLLPLIVPAKRYVTPIRKYLDNDNLFQDVDLSTAIEFLRNELYILSTHIKSVEDSLRVPRT